MLQPSTQEHSSSTLEIDITGSSIRSSVCEPTCTQSNLLNTVVGNPFSTFIERPPSESEDGDSSSDDDFDFRIDSIVEEMYKTDSDVESNSDVNSLSDMDLSEVDDEATLTMIEDVFIEDEPQNINLSSCTSTNTDTEGPDISTNVTDTSTCSPETPFAQDLCKQSETSTSVTDTISLEMPVLQPPCQQSSDSIPYDSNTSCPETSVAQPPCQQSSDSIPYDSNTSCPETSVAQPPCQQSSDSISYDSNTSCPETSVAQPPCQQSGTDNTTTETSTASSDSVKESLQKSFTNLTSTEGIEDIVDLQRRTRVIVSIQKLCDLKGDFCQVIIYGKVCLKQLEFWAKHVGTRVEIEWKCANNHYGKWESSEVLSYNHYSKVFANDSLVAAALILSGYNYTKFDLFCNALNLYNISKTNFCHFQSKCALPVVQNTWNTMRTNVIQVLQNCKDICLSGDGRNDSPGHSARYCVYSLMDHSTKAIVDVEVLDKRETVGNSATMEREGLRRLLEKLMKEITISELCTDASSTVIKMVREMKVKFPLLANMFHSLDIWHKAKKLSKSLHKAAKVKNCSELKVWIEPIVNHFWYCAQVANKDVDKLKSVWEGVLHHVCGKHSWAESECSHSPEAEADTTKPPLSKTSKAMEALRKIVLDVKWMKTLHFYVRFRHTGELENFNSMMTKYAPKRMAFEYPYFIMRILLAAIDHNFHLFREVKRTKEGKVSGHRKYSKRTQKFHAEVVKEEKSYEYFSAMAAKMLENRILFKGRFQGKGDVADFHPRQIAATIGMKDPPPTEELMKGPSRFNFLKKETQELIRSDAFISKNL